MDVRYCIPPMLNSIFFLFLSPLNWNLMVFSFFVQQFSVLQLAFVVLAMMFLLLFLFTSAELPFTVTFSSILFRTGAFSVALTASFLASVFLPPSLFWPVYLLIVFSSPWHGLFFDVSKNFFRRFSAALQSVPAYTVTVNAQNDEDLELGLMHQHDQVEL